MPFPELVLAYKPRKGVTREASREVWQFVIGTVKMAALEH